MSKRKEAKYPALEKGLNVKSRKDFIEVDYVNGVKNSNGEQVIRPLNEEEKAFLNQFYEETVVTNFSHDVRIKHLNKRRKDIEISGQILISGFTSIIISIWFLSGLIIFSIGIVGIFIGKIFDEAKDRPLYIIESTSGKFQI